MAARCAAVFVFGLLQSFGDLSELVSQVFVFDMALMHLCAWPACHKPVPIGSKYCKAHERGGRDRDDRMAKEREERRVRQSGTSAERGYGSRWRAAAKAFLSKHPVCAECERQGKFTMATCVDHIVPHKGDRSLFWDKSNWQPLCQSCHSKKTACEDGGFGNASAS